MDADADEITPVPPDRSAQAKQHEPSPDDDTPQPATVTLVATLPARLAAQESAEIKHHNALRAWAGAIETQSKSIELAHDAEQRAQSRETHPRERDDDRMTRVSSVQLDAAMGYRAEAEEHVLKVREDLTAAAEELKKANMDVEECIHAVRTVASERKRHAEGPHEAVVLDHQLELWSELTKHRKRLQEGICKLGYAIDTLCSASSDLKDASDARVQEHRTEFLRRASAHAFQARQDVEEVVALGFKRADALEITVKKFDYVEEDPPHAAETETKVGMKVWRSVLGLGTSERLTSPKLADVEDAFREANEWMLSLRDTYKAARDEQNGLVAEFAAALADYGGGRSAAMVEGRVVAREQS